MHLLKFGYYLLYAFIPAFFIYLLFTLIFIAPLSFQSFLYILILGFILYLLFIQFGKFKRKGIKKASIVFYFLFFVYIFFMIHILFLSSDFARDPSLIMHSDYRSALALQIENGTNLTPFVTIKRMLLIFDLDYIENKIAITNLVGNFIIFMPFSFFALKIFYKKFKNPLRFMFWTAFIIILVEVLQLLTLTGSCDIDDFILNFSGALIAYIILRLSQIILQN